MSQATTPPPLLRLRRSFVLLILTTLALVLSWPAGPATAATASPSPDTTVSWSVRPADTAQGTARPNFAYDAQPGSTLADAIVVTNRSTAPIELDVYAADGLLTADGSLDILPGGEPSAELGTWISVGTPDITLESGESREVPFDLTVPASTPPGDYAAGIVAAMVVEAEGTVTERRLGSRVHVRVLGDLAPAVTVSDVSVDYRGTVNPVEGGAATVTYTLTNTGNTRLEASADITLAGPFGLAPLTIADDAPELLPGSSIERRVDLGGVPALGVLTADVSVTAEVVSRSADDTQALPAPATAAASAMTAAVPWTVLVIIVVVAGLIVWRILAVKRARVSRQRAIDEAVAAARAEQASAQLVAAGSSSPSQVD